MGAAAAALLVLSVLPRPARPADASSLWDGSRLPSQGVRREAYWSGTHFTLSCEHVAGHSGLSGEDLNWPEGREAFRRFADAPLSWESRGAVSKAAWDFSKCWCSCGHCPDLFRVCALGATTALAAMLLTVSVTTAARVANFMNVESTCSEADPYVMLFQSLPPWPEVLHSSWPFFGVLARVAEQMQEDGLEEWHLARIFTLQRRSRGDGETPEPQAAGFCAVLGYAGGPSRCPLGQAQELLASALDLAAPRRGAPAPVDAVEALVRRAQDQIHAVLPRVPGHSRCMQAQNLGLGLSLAAPGLWHSLAKLQRLLEARFHAAAPSSSSSSSSSRPEAICPVAGARWQGEWLSETDFLSDFGAELQATLATHPKLGTLTSWAGGEGAEAGEAPAAAADAGVAGTSPSGLREAWVCTLFAGPELSWKQVALHAEFVRTLAHSVRTVSRRPRPFVVLTESTLPEDLAAELEGDGLRLAFFERAPLLLSVPEELLRTMSWWTSRSLRPTMGQLAVWNLTDYDRVVMLDDDMLMLRPCDELFSVPVFAMSHDPAPWWAQHKADGRVLSRLNNAARVVQPDAELFGRMVERIQSGALKDHPIVNFFGYDLQSLEDAFWSQHSGRLGTVAFEGGDGAFLGCSIPNASRMEPARHERLVIEVDGQHREDFHCTLPAQYNFFVDYKSVFGLVYYGLSGVDMLEASVRLLMQRAVAALVDQGSLTSPPKILHWPGDMRKPWQRPHPRARTAWDEAWWRAHAALCRESAGPCRIACEHGPPPRNASV